MAATRTAAKKAPAKKAATKKAATVKMTRAAAAASKPAAKKTTAKTAKKTKATAGGNAKKSGAAKRPARKPILLGGEPAGNRHFALDEALYKRAASRSNKTGVRLAQVLRHGLALYAADAPPEAPADGKRLLPPDGMETLQQVWETRNNRVITPYIVALVREGWPYETIADSIVAFGGATTMSRQAVQQRCTRFEGDLPADLPPVPSLGPRRSSPTLVRPGRKTSGKVHDLAFRVADSVYEAAARRAQTESAMMLEIGNETLRSWLAGDYDEELLGDSAR